MKAWIQNVFVLFMVLNASLSLAQREYQIHRVDVPPTIDGVLNENEWRETDIATDFTTKSPVFGEKSKFRSEVHMFYDDAALYFAGELFDPNPDSISYSLSNRDDEGNADWFGISLDTYGNNLNAFVFMITAAGVELDAEETVTNFDVTWNAVWRSAVAKMENGWSFEIKIPFSAIRFPNKEIQNWNFNFWRSVRRVREESTWNPIDPNVFGEITQSGKLIGVNNIKSPLRLSFTPYATGYIENSYDSEKDAQTWKARATYGLDLKLGLNDAFTLDMTLIPDFGQTVSDRQVLNLGPFEVQFNENRPFFLEGTDLFGTGGIFYSRRIASTPYRLSKPYSDLDESLGEEVISNPNEAPMLNGTKISGRTKKGLGIGVFNALEGETFALIRDSLGNERRIETNPFTNYNVFVLSQNLKNNSQIALVNTNVMRDGSAHDANVTFGGIKFYTPDGKYRVQSSIAISSIFENEEPEFGHTMFAGIYKVSGVWRYSFSYNEMSDTYNPNDLGFLYNNNSRSYDASLSWNDFKGTKHFFRRNANLSVGVEELYKPQRFQYSYINWNLGGLLKKQIYTSFYGNINPFGSVNHFESRTFGREVNYNPNASVGWQISTDYSKRFAIDIRTSYKYFFGPLQHGTSVSVSPRLRISDRVFFVLSSSVEFIKGDYGYVNTLDEDYNDEIILGYRDRTIVENTFNLEYIFTKRMGLDVRIRHYWQQVEYKDFVSLLDEGETRETDYNPLEIDGNSSHNTSYNAFTIDINYKWVFIPGSELRIVYKNNIFSSKTNLDNSYFDTFKPLFQEPRINSISMKLLVFIDALYFKRKRKK